MKECFTEQPKQEPRQESGAETITPAVKAVFSKYGIDSPPYTREAVLKKAHESVTFREMRANAEISERYLEDVIAFIEKYIAENPNTPWDKGFEAAADSGECDEEGISLLSRMIFIQDNNRSYGKRYNLTLDDKKDVELIRKSIKENKACIDTKLQEFDEKLKAAKADSKG